MIKHEIIVLKNVHQQQFFNLLKLLFVFLLFVSSYNCYALEKRSVSGDLITLNVRNKTIREVFSEIEKQSGYVFFYSPNVLDANKKVSLSVKNQPISKVLEKVFAGTDNNYTIRGRQITIYKKSAPNTYKKTRDHSKIENHSRLIQISGTVFDKDKNTLPGVSVKISGQNVSGTVTDLNGHFYLNVPNRNSTIEVSYIGYKSQNIKVGNNINFDIILEENVSAINEVVVTGYGSQKKLSIVGAIENIAPSQLQMGSTRSLSNNLAGQIAGVVAVTRNGEPGYDNSDFWIRGISSFSAGGTTPLVLIDGIERDLNNIDPAEIESFAVLKDASATAMYGVRGANGVIIITTKRGKIGPPSVDVRVEHAITQPTKLPKFLNGADYMELIDELTEDKTQLPYSEEQIEKTRSHYDLDLYPDVDWIKEITNDYAYNTRANLTVNGGSSFLRYALVSSWYNERGIVTRDKKLSYDTSILLNRFNMRSNVDLDITKTTTLRLNLGGYMQNRRSPNTDVAGAIDYAFDATPMLYPARYSDGTIPVISNRSNPWALLTQSGYSIYIDTQFQSLLSIEQNLKMLTPGLKAKLTFSFDSYNESERDRSTTPTYYTVATGRDAEGNLIHSVLSYGSEALSSSNRGVYGTKNVYLEGTLTYDRIFDKHDIDALFLYNQQSYDIGDYQPYRKQGIAGRISDVFEGRYIGEFNFGYNGSENFAKGHRFGFFPSFAIGWMISEEPFMSKYRNVFNKIKLRGSYGKVGNDNIGGRRFAYITTVYTNQDRYDWGDNGQVSRNGITEGDIGVKNLTWETSWKSDIGLELGLWNSLELQADIFKEKRSNIFMQRTIIPADAGFITTPWANYGKVTNKGIDASLNYEKKINNNLNVGFRSTFTYASNKINEKDEAEGVIGTYRGITGRSMNTLWGLQAERLFTKDDFDANGNLKYGIPTQNVGAATVKPGDIKYKDMNGDGVINDEDEGYIGGTQDPKIVYGFGGNISFCHIDFDIFFQGVGDTYRIIGGTSYFIPGSGEGVLGDVYSNYKDCWTEEKPSQHVFWPRLSAFPNEQNYRASSWWKKNMSFLRCRTIELGYSLPESFNKKLQAKNIRFYLSGNNLFCISKFKLWDPELSSVDGCKYPQMSSVMFGIDVNF